MRVARGLGLAGVGAAMGAAVMIPAAASAGTTYNSTATATAGSVTAAGNDVPVPDNSVTATPQNSPQSGALGASALESALGSSASPIAASLKAALPSGADLVTESATASAGGDSTACAGFLLSGDCTPAGKPQALTLNLSLADLPGLKPPAVLPKTGKTNQSQSSSAGNPAASGGIPASLPTSIPTSLPKLGGSSPAPDTGSASAASSSPSPASALNNIAIVLSLSGPQAACTAGPSGSAGSGFTATQSLAAVTLDIQRNGQSLLPNGPVSLKSGDILSQIPLLGQNSSLNQALSSAGSSLSAVQNASPLDLTINPGSTSGAGAGPKTTATAGELGLAVSGTQLLDVKGAQATCGANKPVVAPATPPAKTTSSEMPLGGGIQTDEGRSGPGSDAGAWAAAAGAAALAGTASGLTLWRRRRGIQ